MSLSEVSRVNALLALACENERGTGGGGGTSWSSLAPVGLTVWAEKGKATSLPSLFVPHPSIPCLTSSPLQQLLLLTYLAVSSISHLSVSRIGDTTDTLHGPLPPTHLSLCGGESVYDSNLISTWSIRIHSLKVHAYSHCIET